MVLLLNSVVASQLGWNLVSYISVSSLSLKGFVKVNPWRKEWLLSPVFLPREFHWQRSLVGYSPWCCKESDMTEWLELTSYFLSFFNRFLAVFVVLLCSSFLLIYFIVVWWISLTLCLDYFLFIFWVSIVGLWLLWSLYVSACILVILFKLIVPWVQKHFKKCIFWSPNYHVLFLMSCFTYFYFVYSVTTYWNVSVT